MNYIRPLILSLLSLCAVLTCGAKGRSELLQSVFALTDTLSAKHWYYKGSYYYRGAVRLHKKNLVILSNPNRRFYMKDGHDLLTEDMGDMEYYAPNMLTRKIRHTYGSVPGYDVTHGYIMDFFNVNISGAFLLADHILSPLHRKNIIYYRYSCDSVKHHKAYFSFRRKRRNMQLVDGAFVYDMQKGYVCSISFSGRYNFISFTEHVTMGTEGDERFWPQRMDMTYRYWYYGNTFTGNTVCTHNYDVIRRRFFRPKSVTDRHDLTPQYALALDTARAAYDSTFIARHRPIALSRIDSSFYAEAKGNAAPIPISPSDTAPPSRHTTPRWIKQLGHVGEFFFNDYDIMENSYSRLRILSPTPGYSGSNGVTYRQDLEYIRFFSRGRSWSVVPRLSYFFKNSELTGRVRSELLLIPKSNATISFEAGIQKITANSNNLFFIKKDSEGKETVESLDFTDFYTSLDAKRELANGLDASIGIVMHHRRPKGYAKQHHAELMLRDRYRDFAPRLTLTFTPHQYYYRVGDRKVRLHSAWPTFVLNYERGIKGLLGSTNAYERWECMATGGMRLTPVHRLIWKAGGGMFTNRANADFVQYEYFNNGIYAYNWDDDRSGVFQLLDQKYYNNSYHYLRGHAVIESPMLLLGNISTRVIRAERLYVNALLTEGLVPYLEFGYGVSNELLDVSFFSSYIKGESLKTGLKFSLHIFD